MTGTRDKNARAARAREAQLARHARLQAVLDHWAGVLAAAVGSGAPVRPPVQNPLPAFLTDEMLPHARAEERTLCRAAWHAPAAGLLVRALISEHRDLASVTDRLRVPAGPAAIAAQTTVMNSWFASHRRRRSSCCLC